MVPTLSVSLRSTSTRDLLPEVFGMRVRAVEVSRATTGFASPGGRDFSLVPSGQPLFARRSGRGTNPGAERNRRVGDDPRKDRGSKGSEGHGYTRFVRALGTPPRRPMYLGGRTWSRDPRVARRGSGPRPGGRVRCSSDSRIAPGASWFSRKKKRGCSTTTTP